MDLYHRTFYPALPRDVAARPGSSWISVDPLARKYPGWSPYNYVRDNPITSIDPNGGSEKPKPPLADHVCISLEPETRNNTASISANGFATAPSSATAAASSISLGKSEAPEGSPAFNAFAHALVPVLDRYSQAIAIDGTLAGATIAGASLLFGPEAIPEGLTAGYTVATVSNTGAMVLDMTSAVVSGINAYLNPSKNNLETAGVQAFTAFVDFYETPFLNDLAGGSAKAVFGF